jgi:hypothetical protein
MHYRNGRVANNGDMVMLIPKYGNSQPVVGILYNAQAGNDNCNGQLALVRSGDPCPNLKECLHIEDAKAALAEEMTGNAPGGSKEAV